MRTLNVFGEVVDLASVKFAEFLGETSLQGTIQIISNDRKVAVKKISFKLSGADRLRNKNEAHRLVAVLNG